MDYQQKYLKYKNKYLELKYNQKSGFTGKSGLYTYFTSEQILKDNDINYFPNAKAPSIYTMNNKLNNVGYRVSEGSRDLELVIDNETRARKYGDVVLGSAEGIGNFITAAGNVAAISIDVLAIVLSEGTAAPATAGIDSGIKMGANIAGKLTNESVKQLRKAIKVSLSLPMVIKLNNPFKNESEESINEILQILSLLAKQQNFKVNTAITLDVNKLLSNTFHSKKDLHANN